MKVCIVQPPYSTDFSQAEEYFRWEMEAFDRCDESMDLIVFPESADTPCMAHSEDDVKKAYEMFFDRLYKKAVETAKRCNAVLFFNAHEKGEKGFYNSTFAIDRNGELAGIYHKQHLTPGEISNYKLVSDYTYEHSVPQVIEIDGIRYCFLTCYDFYFYEIFPAIARQKPDIIIGCSHQRSDKQSALETINRFCAYNTNAYVVRSSVSMGEDTDIGGGSCVVAPDGEMLIDMKSRVGLATVEIDPMKKYYKPAGFGNPDAAHYEYIEKGRRPWKYRNAGSAIVNPDSKMAYPRVCAHRGFNTVAPENSMAAYGSAVALGAEEIELDLWVTKDGEIVSSHDGVLDRVSDGTGVITDFTYEELLKLDFGFKCNEHFKGLKILKFEEILKKFAGHTIMNIHIKTHDFVGEYDEDALRKIVALIEKYDCKDYVYFMCGNKNFMRLAREVAPDIARCMGAGEDAWNIVENAIEYDCKKVQLFKPYFNKEMIDKAHANGIICNVFWADEPDEAVEFVKMGIDTVLTNDYLAIANAINKYKKSK